MGRLTISALQKFYGKSHALRGIDLDIPEGEFTVFVGPSGCGKSTLLRCIAGLEDIDGGTVAIDNAVINGMRPRDRDIAMVFQNYALYPYMNVFENIAFGLRARHFADDEINQRVQQASTMLGLQEYLQRFPRQLSGGQRQRVAIGRAIVRDARLFLFDEPLSNLDAQLREGMRSEIKRLHQEIGKTMVYVTHDQVEAMTLADRIVLLKDGKIEQSGSPLELFEKPVSRFVASFIGSPTINLVPCRLQSVDDELIVQFDEGQQLKIPPKRTAALLPHQNKPLEIGIRAEHLSVSSDGPLPVTIDLVQPTGTRSYGTFQLSGKAVVAELPAHTIEHAGVQLRLEVDMHRSLLIDSSTGIVIGGK